MPIKAEQRFTAWSYSRLSDYEGCPRLAKFKHLDKLKEPPSEALERGSRIHKQAESFVRGRLFALPESLARFPDEFAALRARKDVDTELQLAVNREWRPCDWFGADAWLRVVVDVTFAGVRDDEPGRTLIDYKTGKIRSTHGDQLDLYGLIAFAYHPGVKAVKGALWYLDQGEIKDRLITRAEVPALQAKWEKRAAPLLADATFAPRPGDSCRWCYFGQSKAMQGGPGLCEF